MDTGSHYSVFTKDEFHYCVQIDHVREVIRTPTLVLAPVLTSGFLGYLDFRQTLCPVIDIHAAGGSRPPSEAAGPHTLMVLECESRLFAVLIDRFVESLVLETAEGAEETPPLPEVSGQLVDQVFRYRGKALNRLNLHYLKSFVENNIHVQLQGQDTQLHPEEEHVDPKDEIEMVCFGIDHHRFGIPITDLIEVVSGYSVEPLFQTNSFLRGLINLRGQIIACVDISEAIGLSSRKMEEKNQYILLQHEEQDLALCIDSISKKQKFLRSQIQNVDHIFSGELADYLLGIIEAGTERIFVISGPKIFASRHLLPYQE
ncbi:MAG: chemotaxis protein CheW [Spirochaetales bacterium]